MNLLVVPSVREASLKEFIHRWMPFEKKLIDDLIVIEDNPAKTFRLSINHHYSWKEIEDDLGENLKVVRGDFLAPEIHRKRRSDSLKRSLIRHDSEKLAEAVFKLMI